MQRVAQFPQQRGHAAGGMEILHVAFAGRLQVDQHRRVVGERVEAVEIDRARRAARRWPSGGSARWSSRRAPAGRAARSRPTLGDELRRAGPARRSAASPARRPPRRRAGGRHARRGCGRVPAGMKPSASAMQAIVLAVPITPQVPAVVASRPSISAIRSAARPARRDRPPSSAGNRCRPTAARPGSGVASIGPVTSWTHGDVGRGRGHQLRRHGLVAAADHHRRVHRLRRQHRLGVEGGEVAVVHARSGTATARRARWWGRASAARPPPARRASPPRRAPAWCGGSC